MKKIYTVYFIAVISLLIFSNNARGQCLIGTNAAVVKWDQLDYLTRNGTYSAFVTNAMMQTQYFTIGVNRLSINFPIASMTTAGENTTNTAEAGSNGTGADVEYNGNGAITITFDNVVNNFRFSLYDIDLLQSARVTALDGAAVPLPITMTAVTAGVITVTGSGGTTPTATTSNTALANTDTRGTLNMTIAGATGVKSVSIIMGFGGGTAGNFWLSDLNACVSGTFPNNYYISQQPFTGQPAYYLVTPDNNSVYLMNPLTGRCDWLFAEPGSPWVNSMAYDHVNKVLYYVQDHPSPLSTNKSLKKYDFNTETISTVVNDITTLGIPIFDIVVESAGAAFYNGSLFIGIEGTNGAKNSSRESIIWRIDFDAALNPVRVAQVFARPADNGSGLLTHDWGDFTIKDGVLYDFNTGNSGSTSQFVHFNMQSANTTFYNTNGNPAPIQAGQLWDGRLYWTGGQSPETGRVARYNENGTIGAKIVATVSICSPPWVGRAGDASDPFRPKSDYGDAPASYDPIAQERATHEYDCNLRLGATFDREWQKTPSADASADGTDEDGIATVTLLPPGVVTYVQDVEVYNNTGVNATLAGWLDYNGNGLFDASEGVTMNVPSTGAMQTVTLSWPSINNTLPLGSTTFSRFRLTSASNGMTVNNATMWRANGEVEDYRVYINVVLPINLLSLTAENEADKRVLLNWETDQEINFKGFDIERSKDGLMWQKIAHIPAHNNGNNHNKYNKFDYDPIPGQSFYRLRLVDVDGKFKYSYVVDVTIKPQYSGLKIFPNPVMHTANMQVYSDKNESATLYVTDMNGKRLLQKLVSLKVGSNTITVDGWDRFAAGMYVVQLVTADTKMNGKVVVQPK